MVQLECGCRIKYTQSLRRRVNVEERLQDCKREKHE